MSSNVTFDNIIWQYIVAVPSSQNRIVHMPMRVDKPRGNDFVGTVNDLDVVLYLYIWRNLSNPVIFDQDVGFDSSSFVVGSMNDHYSILQECLPRHCSSSTTLKREVPAKGQRDCDLARDQIAIEATGSENEICLQFAVGQTTIKSDDVIRVGRT